MRKPVAGNDPHLTTDRATTSDTGEDKAQAGADVPESDAAERSPNDAPKSAGPANAIDISLRRAFQAELDGPIPDELHRLLEQLEQKLASAQRLNGAPKGD
ncbi:MAG: NepR family anti-sigma factor [Gemmobacter sp.]|nr:NepR family anti-sigma factor [Gemmobacter sp.]